MRFSNLDVPGIEDIRQRPLTERNTALRGAFTPEQVRSRFEVREWDPPADLVPWVSHLWRVQWSLSPGESHVGKTLPHPVVHIVFEDDGTANVVGPIPVRFERRLEGDGGVLGVHMHPALFRAICPMPLSELQNRRVDADDLFGPEVQEVAAKLPNLELPARCLAICDWLRTQTCDPPAHLVRLRNATEAAIRGEVDRVPDFAEMLGVSERTALRWCRDAVGWTPQQIVRRHRVHEALSRLENGCGYLAELALDLGYSDQAHFSRDFKATTGLTPMGYVGT